jgi:hypothetical protein
MTQPEEPEKGPWRKALKALLITLVVLLALVVVGFGLLVGFCALAFRRH